MTVDLKNLVIFILAIYGIRYAIYDSYVGVRIKEKLKYSLTVKNKLMHVLQWEIYHKMKYTPALAKQKEPKGGELIEDLTWHKTKIKETIRAIGWTKFINFHFTCIFCQQLLVSLIVFWYYGQPLVISSFLSATCGFILSKVINECQGCKKNAVR